MGVAPAPFGKNIDSIDSYFYLYGVEGSSTGGGGSPRPFRSPENESAVKNCSAIGAVFFCASFDFTFRGLVEKNLGEKKKRGKKKKKASYASAGPSFLKGGERLKWMAISSIEG